MSPNPQRKQAIIEGALYVLIVFLAGLPAVFYKVLSNFAPGVRFNFWAVLPYCAVLVWAFTRLNSVHRKRKAQQAASVPETPQVQPPAPVVASVDARRAVLGLSVAQIAVVVLVFAAAVVSFTWVLSVLR